MEVVKEQESRCRSALLTIGRARPENRGSAIRRAAREKIDVSFRELENIPAWNMKAVECTRQRQWTRMFMAKQRKSEIEVRGTRIGVRSIRGEDFISLTDMVTS
jgi:hypothetical protein